MSYGRQNSSYGSYNNYQSEGRRISNNFGGDQNGQVKRRKFQSRKRLANQDMIDGRNYNAKSHDSFKEPLLPNRSPGIMRDKAFRSPARDYLDSFKGSHFVEPQHAGAPWSWEIYNRECKAWQDKHKLAYYKSRCMALEFENQMLFQQISTLIDENDFLAAERGVMPTQLGSGLYNRLEEPAKPASSVKKQGKTRQNKTTTTTSQTSGSGVEFEICEDMMAYLEKSMRHKLNLKKGKQQAKENVEDKKEKDKENKKGGPKQPMGQKREEELELFYGKNANMIQGLETALQLNFNRSCDTHRPKIWMAAPLNPNTVDEASDN